MTTRKVHFATAWLTAWGLAVWMLAVAAGPARAADDEDEEATEAPAGELVMAADVMKSAEEYHDKQVCVKGTIQRIEQSDKGSFFIVLDNNLRCKMRRAEVEKKYGEFNRATAGSYYTQKSQIKMVISKANGTAKIVYTSSYRENNTYSRDTHNKTQVDVEIFAKGDSIEVAGNVKRVSSNRVLVENGTVARYDWPKLNFPRY